jgi:hypothetical protein
MRAWNPLPGIKDLTNTTKAKELKKSAAKKGKKPVPGSRKVPKSNKTEPYMQRRPKASQQRLLTRSAPIFIPLFFSMLASHFPYPMNSPTARLNRNT